MKMTVSLPKHKEENILALCHQLLDSDIYSIQFLTKVIGSLVSCFHVCPLGQLHYHSMERLKINGLTKKRFNWDVEIHITSAVKSDLKWWIAHIPLSTVPIWQINPTTILNTNLSGYAWGSNMDGFKALGMFTENEMKLSINSKVTLAIWCSIESFKYLFQKTHFLVLSDNCTDISNVKKFGN